AGETARAGRDHVLQVAARRIGARGSTLQSTRRAVQRARCRRPDADEEHQSAHATTDTRRAHADENAGRTIRHARADAGPYAPDARRESTDADRQSIAAGRDPDAACLYHARDTRYAALAICRAESDGFAKCRAVG